MSHNIFCLLSLSQHLKSLGAVQVEKKLTCKSFKSRSQLLPLIGKTSYVSIFVDDFISFSFFLILKFLWSCQSIDVNVATMAWNFSFNQAASAGSIERKNCCLIIIVSTERMFDIPALSPAMCLTYCNHCSIFLSSYSGNSWKMIDLSVTLN